MLLFYFLDNLTALLEAITTMGYLPSHLCELRAKRLSITEDEDLHWSGKVNPLDCSGEHSREVDGRRGASTVSLNNGLAPYKKLCIE